MRTELLQNVTQENYGVQAGTKNAIDWFVTQKKNSRHKNCNFLFLVPSVVAVFLCFRTTYTGNW